MQCVRKREVKIISLYCDIPCQEIRVRDILSKMALQAILNLFDCPAFCSLTVIYDSNRPQQQLIDALVSLPEDRLLYQDLQGLASGQLIDWSTHRYVRTISGHKQTREVQVASAGELTSWDGFTDAAATYDEPDGSLWACLIRDVTTQETTAKSP